MGKLRAVKWTDGNGFVKEGYFHQCGQTIGYDDNGNAHPRTSAIVEREDGRVFQIDPGSMTFTEDFHDEP